MRLTRIKLYRLQSGLRQIELAQRADIARCRLSELECGWIEPRAEELKRLARALGVSVENLAAEVRP